MASARPGAERYSLGDFEWEESGNRVNDNGDGYGNDQPEDLRRRSWEVGGEQINKQDENEEELATGSEEDMTWGGGVTRTRTRSRASAPAVANPVKSTHSRGDSGNSINSATTVPSPRLSLASVNDLMADIGASTSHGGTSSASTLPRLPSNHAVNIPKRSHSKRISLHQLKAQTGVGVGPSLVSGRTTPLAFPLLDSSHPKHAILDDASPPVPPPRPRSRPSSRASTHFEVLVDDSSAIDDEGSEFDGHPGHSRKNSQTSSRSVSPYLEHLPSANSTSTSALGLYQTHRHIHAQPPSPVSSIDTASPARNAAGERISMDFDASSGSTLGTGSAGGARPNFGRKSTLRKPKPLPPPEPSETSQSNWNLDVDTNLKHASSSSDPPSPVLTSPTHSLPSHPTIMPSPQQAPPRASQSSSRVRPRSAFGAGGGLGDPIIPPRTASTADLPLPMSPYLMRAATNPNLGALARGSGEGSASTHAHGPYLPRSQSSPNQTPVIPPATPVIPPRTSGVQQLRQPKGLTPRTASLRTNPVLPRTANSANRGAQPHPLASQATAASLPPQPTIPKQLKPIVNPALLSQVAVAFRQRVEVKVNTRDNLEYKDSFTGREAVDALCYLMRTTDRNLALLLGRALDAQKYFHDVLYLHRLRDNPVSLYQFRESGVPRSVGLGTPGEDNGTGTVTRDRVCYSVACPRRAEQQLRQIEKAADAMLLGTRNHETGDEKSPTSWTSTIAPELLPTVPATEQKRQEAIFELVLRVKEFVDDLEVIQGVYISGIRNGKAGVRLDRREIVVREVFGNVGQIYQSYSRLSRRLLARQKERPLVDRIGDVMLSAVPELKHFVEYGSNQHFSKNALEVEREGNPDFAGWLQ
ncbi:RHO1 GDP-GTP exchange protein 2, partial [Gonapodya sp. JEL0774]